MLTLGSILPESIGHSPERAEHGVAAVLKHVELAQRAARYLPREAALADLVARHRALIHHLVYGTGLLEQIDAIQWANQIQIEEDSNMGNGVYSYNKHPENNTIITFAAWEPWKHKNDCVFNGANPFASAIIQAAVNEGLFGAWLEQWNSTAPRLAIKILSPAKLLKIIRWNPSIVK
ncbi:hypothetical protein EJB05_30997, partial [Eragrostis curvula]